MEPVDIGDVFSTCKTIVNSEIKVHCDAITEKLNTLIPITDTKGQKKRLKVLRKKVKKVSKFINRLK